MPRRGGPQAKPRAERSQPAPRRHDAPTRRETTLYDAIAGRVTSEGFLPPKSTTSRYRDTASHSTQPISPEKALFRFKGRDFAGENDPYWADRYLTVNQQLPDSDILKAIHAYASDFYSRSLGEEAIADFQSMNETALLGLGILLEEMADEVLGETGDLAFTEGEAVGPESKRRTMRTLRMSSDMSTTDTSMVKEPTDMTAEEYGVSLEPRSSKRRKTRHHESED